MKNKKLTRLLSVVLSALMLVSLLSFSAFAADTGSAFIDDDGETDSNISWSCSNGKLTISGAGEMNDYNSGSAPWYDYKDSINKVVINSGVTSIGDYAFKDFNNLTFVSIPNNIKTIGSNAFLNCSELNSVDLCGGVKSINKLAFANTAIKSIYIPKSIDYVGEYAFGFNYDEDSDTKEMVSGFKVYYAKSTSSAAYIGTVCDYYGFAKEAVKLSAASASLKAGGTKTLKSNGGFVKSWVSNRKSVAAVKNGKVSALKKGTATITAKLSDGTKITSKITVKTSPKLSRSSVTVKKKKTVSVKITGKVGGINNVYTNTKYAKITSAKTASTLKVKGLKKGSTTLKVKVNGVTLKLKVKVK